MLQTESHKINVNAIVTPVTRLSDNAIIERIKAGDSNAYASIMRRYNQQLFRVARSFVTDNAAAMDVVQEAHIKAYTKLADFRGSSSFFAWLASITRNEALMYLRKHKKEVRMSGDEEPSNRLNGLPDVALENKQLQRLINQNIDQLPEDFRTVFVLRAIEQLSVKETAEILDIKQETVKTRYFRAKRLLRGKLQAYLDVAGMSVYEFGGKHCDTVVHNVLCYLGTCSK
jgi:RNA polymerase sigma-70 factor (ECF subfamily)